MEMGLLVKLQWSIAVCSVEKGIAADVPRMRLGEILSGLHSLQEFENKQEGDMKGG